MFENLNEKFRVYMSQNPEFRSLIISDKNSLLFKSENANLDLDSVIKIINSWDAHDGSVMVGENRHILLKSDPLQLATVCPGKNVSLVGVNRNGKYAISFLENCKNVNASSVYFQKFIIDFI